MAILEVAHYNEPPKSGHYDEDPRDKICFEFISMNNSLFYKIFCNLISNKHRHLVVDFIPTSD